MRLTRFIALLIFCFCAAHLSYSEECIYCKTCAAKTDGSCASESGLCWDPTTTWGGFCHTITKNKRPVCTCETTPPRSFYPEDQYEM